MNIRHLIFLFTFLSAGNAGCQVFPVDTLMKNGPVGKRINLVFIGDGYRKNEAASLKNDATNFMNGIFSETPFKEYRNYFNAFLIEVASAESGVNHPQNTTDPDCLPVPKSTANNYFGSSFDTDGIHRLLSPTNMVAVGKVLSLNFPAYDEAFVIVNTPYYGGSGDGGTGVAVASLNSDAVDVSKHELGHALALLADEYWAGEIYAAEKPNMTAVSDASTIKWKNWLNINGVGIYPHEENPLWFRPHQSCKMRALDNPFCSVCREAFVERIHDLVNPISSWAPIDTAIALGVKSLAFQAQYALPDPATLKITWKLNNKMLGKNLTDITLAVNQFVKPSNLLRVEVIDTTLLSKSVTHLTKHLYLLEWHIHTNPITGLEISSTEADFKVSLYPNPVAEQLNMSYSLSRPAMVKMTMTDELGRTVKTIVNQQQSAGQYDFAMTPAELNMTKNGLYILQMEIDGSRMSERLIKL